MILVDTGPLVALFDPQDEQHNRCRGTLKEIREPILTTTPVLTEAFHMLGPASIGSDRLREFVEVSGLSVWFLDCQCRLKNPQFAPIENSPVAPVENSPGARRL